MGKDTLRKRIDYIDILRAIGILSMIIGHLEIGGSKIDHFIHAFHMPLFFIVSGYFHHERNWKNQFARKVRTILVPYFVFGLFHYVIWLLLNYKSSYNLLRPLQCLFFDCTSLDMPIAGALWFLPCLFLVEAIYLILEKTIGWRYRWIPVVLISLLGNFWFVISPTKLPFALDSAFVGLGLYYIGIMLKKIDFTTLLDKVSVFVKIAFALLVVVLVMKNGYVNMRTGNYGFIPLFWFNAVLLTILLWDLSKRIWIKLNLYAIGRNICRYICGIGRRSMVYLAFNQLSIYLATSIIIIIGLREWTFFACIEKYIKFVLVMILLYLAEVFFTRTKMKIVLGK